MQLRNHIAYRFLTDDSLAHEMMETVYPQEYKRAEIDLADDEEIARLAYMFEVISKKDQKAYYITDTVLDKLDMLKVSKKNGVYDWTVFKDIVDCKLTFIFRHNRLLRVLFSKKTIRFCHVEYTYYSKEDKEKYKVPGTAYWINFWVDRVTGYQCDHFQHVDVKGPIETMVYHLLCFFYLSENTEIIVSPGKSYGTKKQPDALVNDVNVPVTIVNSNWNITSIRTEGFNVKGHFRLQPYPSENKTKMILIQPFKKHGYIRRATKQEE